MKMNLKKATVFALLLSTLCLASCEKTHTNEERGRQIGKKLDQTEKDLYEKKEDAKESMKKGIDKL